MGRLRQFCQWLGLRKKTSYSNKLRQRTRLSVEQLEVRALLTAGPKPEFFSLTENQAISVVDPQMVSTDPSAPLTTSVVTPPSHGAVQLFSGGFNYLPNSDYLGSDGWWYLLSDADGNAVCDPIPVTMQINAPNVQPPSLTAPSDQTSFLGDTLSLVLQASAADGGALTFAAQDLPTGLSIDTSSGAITGTIDLVSPPGLYNVIVTATDSHQAATSVSFQWQVSVPGPVISPIPNQFNNHSSTVTVSVNATDPNGDALTYAAAGLPPGLQINGTSGLISGTIDEGDYGVWQVTVSVSDGTYTTASAFTWTVYPPLTATASGSGDVVDPGQPVEFVVSASGGSGSGYHYAWEFGDGNTDEGNSVVHAFDAPDDFGDEYAITVTVTDDFGNWITEDVIVSVVNLPPIGDSSVDMSDDPTVQAAMLADQQAALLDTQAADAQMAQDLAPLVQDPPPPVAPEGPSLGETLAADDIAETAALLAADLQEILAQTAASGDFSATVQAAIAAYDAAANVSNLAYDSTVTAANNSYMASMAAAGQTFVDITSAADDQYHEHIENQDDAFTSRVADLQQALDDQTAAQEQAYADQVAAGQDHLQELLDAADHAFSDQVDHEAALRDQVDAVIETAATAIQQLADGQAQGVFDLDQAAFDQTVADAQAIYAAGVDDQAATGAGLLTGPRPVDRCR
jgi:hypothetical protein